jgi:hypothetical protein
MVATSGCRSRCSTERARVQISRSAATAGSQQRARLFESCERRFVREHVEEDAAESIDIGPLVHTGHSGFELFWRHVGEGAANAGVGFDGTQVSAGIRMAAQGHSPVDHVGLSRGGHDDVLGLEVEVEDAAAMGEFHRIADGREHAAQG